MFNKILEKDGLIKLEVEICGEDIVHYWNIK